MNRSLLAITYAMALQVWTVALVLELLDRAHLPWVVGMLVLLVTGALYGWLAGRWVAAGRKP